MTQLPSDERKMNKTVRIKKNRLASLNSEGIEMDKERGSAGK